MYDFLAQKFFNNEIMIIFLCTYLKKNHTCLVLLFQKISHFFFFPKALPLNPHRLILLSFPVHWPPNEIILAPPRIGTPIILALNQIG